MLRNYLKQHALLSATLVIITVFSIATFAQSTIAASTISTNISTGGNLTVSGTAGITGLTTLGNASTTQLTTTGSTYLATTGGNVGIGTTAPVALFQVVDSDGQGGFAVYDKAGSPNIVGGYSGNYTQAIQMSAILSGGLLNYPNTISGTGSSVTVISGGYDNHISNGGATDTGIASTISGGGHNSIASSHGVICGGSLNVITGSSDYATICGGTGNTITDSQGGFISGGENSSLTSANYGFILGGGNSVTGLNSAAIGNGITMAVSNALAMNFSAAYFINGGSVGIGVATTDYPNEKLDVAGALALRYNIVSAYPNNSTYSAIFSTKSAAPYTYPFDTHGNLVIQPRTSTAAPGDIVFATGATTPSVRMVIDKTGNVGIGTTSPATTLDVNGIIKTQPASSRTCNALAKGGMMYDSDDNHFYGCNGSTWVQLDN